MATNDDVDPNKKFPTELGKPVKDEKNIRSNKYYVFNQTGNIMLSTTVEKSEEIEEEVRQIFEEVSVFFSGMTKAISTTVNPHKMGPNGEKVYYSLYNYDALRKVIDGSGLFVQVTQEDVTHTATSWGVTFSKELLEAVIGLATGTGELAFANAMVSSVGKEGLKISGGSSTDTSKIGNIIFVCEYLMGMPIISALVIYTEYKEVAHTLSIGPCIKEHDQKLTMKLHKDTYMFVLPKYIKRFSKDLLSGEFNEDYLRFVKSLQDLISNAPSVLSIVDGTNQIVSGGTLTKGKTYKMSIRNLAAGIAPSDVKIKLGSVNFTINSVNPDSSNPDHSIVSFKSNSTTAQTDTELTVLVKDNPISSVNIVSLTYTV